MDHQAFAQLLGNYGEFVGAIGVVVTLAYLAHQVRQNARSVVSATSQAITRSQNDLNVAVLASPDLSDLILRGFRDYKSLERAHQYRFNNYLIALLNIYQDVHVQHTQGVAVQDQWEVAREILSQMFSTKNMEDWWSHPRVNMRSRLLPGFAQEIDKIIEQKHSYV